MDNAKNLKPMEMRVRPAHRRLYVFVQLVDRTVSNLYSPPNRRLNPLQVDFELVETFEDCQTVYEEVEETKEKIVVIKKAAQLARSEDEVGWIVDEIENAYFDDDDSLLVIISNLVPNLVNTEQCLNLLTVENTPKPAFLLLFERGAVLAKQEFGE